MYPNWTLVATPLAPWTETREITKCLLNIPDSAGFGWATVPDFNTIDELYKSLKVGPYSYLRIQTVQGFIYRYRFPVPVCPLLHLNAVRSLLENQCLGEEKNPIPADRL